MCWDEAMAPIHETTQFVRRWLDTLDAPISPPAQLRRDNTGMDAQEDRNDDIDGHNQALPARSADDDFNEGPPPSNPDSQHDENHGRGGAHRVPLPKPSTTWTQYLSPLPTMLLPSETPLPTTTKTSSTTSSISSVSSMSSKSSKAPVEVTSVITSTAVGFPPIARRLHPLGVTKSVQVSTQTTWISMTTPIGVITSQPRKGLEPSTVPALPDMVTTTVQGSPSSTGTAVPQFDSAFRDRDHSNDGGYRGGRGNNLDETGEHVLIAAGSIGMCLPAWGSAGAALTDRGAGAFILVCFVSWIIYRMMKKPRQNGSLLGFIRGRNGSGDAKWNDRNGDDMPRSIYMGRNVNSMQDAGYYGDEKVQAGLIRSNTINSQRTLAPQPMAPGSVVMIPAEEYATLTKNQALAFSDVNSTMRSRMPDAYYNQSELARAPSNAYDPAQRQAYRASDVSSLSSGFGDGDIIVPPPPAGLSPAPAQQQNLQPSGLGRFSWMSRRDRGNRETVYTNTSEDRPARYRSVNSWVNQQIGRIKRADERKQSDGVVPPVPDVPASAQTEAASR